MLPVLLLLGMICGGELAPVRVPEETPSTSSLSPSSSTPKKKDIGSLSDYWQAWLLVDTQGGLQSGLDSATLLRRITPKSVFIAPVLPECAEGYHADKMGRCVKSISINATAHKDFILERLKLMFANPPASKNENKKSTGPLQLNIPLVPDVEPQSTEVEFEETFSTNLPDAVSTCNETDLAAGEEKAKPHETNLYDVKNDTTLDEEESTFFLENSNNDDIKKIDRKPPATEFPVTELIEETNDTTFSDVVDYKIPVDLKTLSNSSGVKRVNAESDGTEESVSTTEKRESSTESSPTLVLLISPTKLTKVDDLPSMRNDTVEEIAQLSNFTSGTNESVAITGAPDSALPPAKQLTSIPLDEQRDNETYAEDEVTPVETAKPNDSQDAEFYDEEEDDTEDYPYSTDVPDEEDSAEELLKHGEAGMTIPITRDVERPDRHQRQRNQTADLKALDTRDQVMIRFNDSAPTEDKDEAGSNVSSEVSIDGDFILETTLLDVNTERLQATTTTTAAPTTTIAAITTTTTTTTTLPNVTEKIVRNSEDDSVESFGNRKSPDVRPQVFFSQGLDLFPISANSHESFTPQFSTVLARNKKPEAAASSSESLLHDSPEEDSTAETRTSNEKRSNVKGSVLQESPKDPESNVPASSSARTTMNLDSGEDLVRFYDYVRQPQQDGHVRFPSSEVNSIHGPSYKQNSRYPADDDGVTSTKSSVPTRQKPVYQSVYWNPVRSEHDRITVEAATGDRQNRRPDLMRFWSKLPLIRDPAIYPAYPNNEAARVNEQIWESSHDPYEPDFGGQSRQSRRLDPFMGKSPRSRVRMPKRKTPIGV